MKRTDSATQSAQADGHFTRRNALRTLAWAAAAAVTRPGRASAMPELEPAPASDESRRLLDTFASVDIHTHAGHVIGVDRVRHGGAFLPVAAPMRDGGMAVLCLAIASDSPTPHVTADQRIRPFRDPAPGELLAYAEQSFARVHELARDQGLRVVRAAGIARMADVVGAAHVGLGSDMNGLVGPSALRSYRDLPALADALRRCGFGVDELRGILGGNYARVFRASVVAGGSGGSDNAAT